jgi:glycosyltransferase involved in cell wall biosynthesis
VMIESMACGTPVIAFNNGSVPEIIDNGITGYVVSSIDDAVKAVHDIPLISRNGCRERFEKRFRVEVMVNNYEKVYGKVIELNNQKQKNRISVSYE